VEVMILLLMLTCIIMSSHVVCCQESPFISSESLIYAFSLGIYSLPSKSINQDNSRSSSNPELHVFQGAKKNTHPRSWESIGKKLPQVLQKLLNIITSSTR
jgi:hypothetical protein